MKPHILYNSDRFSQTKNNRMALQALWYYVKICEEEIQLLLYIVFYPGFGVAYSTQTHKVCNNDI